MLGKNYVTNEPRRNDSPVETGKSPSGEENGEQAFTIRCMLEMRRAFIDCDAISKLERKTSMNRICVSTIVCPLLESRQINVSSIFGRKMLVSGLVHR